MNGRTRLVQRNAHRGGGGPGGWQMWGLQGPPHVQMAPRALGTCRLETCSEDRLSPLGSWGLGAGGWGLRGIAGPWLHLRGQTSHPRRRRSAGVFSATVASLPD